MFTSQARAYSEGELDLMVGHARARNFAAGITGALLAAERRFIQVVEGEAEVLMGLRRRLEADTRHHGVVWLLDIEIVQRSFAEAPLALLSREALSAQDNSRLAAVLGLSGDAVPALRSIAVLEAMASPTRWLMSGTLRVVPRQPRAIETVEGLLLAAERILLRDGQAELTVEAAAREAGITHQAAYRYIAGTEGLLRAVVRRRQVLGLDRFLAALARDSYADMDALAHAVIGFMSDICHIGDDFPRPVRESLLNRHHEISYDMMRALGEATAATMLRCCMSETQMDTGLFVIGLAGIGAATKTLLLHDPSRAGTTTADAAMVGMFLGAIRGGPVYAKLHKN
ncbi:BLUF domain-containing protein [Humitalea rosea]|uniref:BLUF domain-containing protein n=1 Tax=Humitalea rosea TaxID=990373 RepID=UPI001313F150|nr:BLUF domain-containing protein [Humitalea rosea]